MNNPRRSLALDRREALRLHPRVFREVLELNRQSSSLIDDLEPLPPAAPVNGPE